MTTIVIVATPGTPVTELADHVVLLPEQVAATGAHFESRAIDPLADLVRVHRLCLLKSRQQGLDPDNPRNLTRSVILDAPTAQA